MMNGLDKKKMFRETMLAKVEDVLLRGGEDDPPAYTLVLGAGASFGVVPTAKEMLGFQDPKTKSMHENCIPVWLSRQLNGNRFDDNDARVACAKRFWKTFATENTGNFRCDGLELDASGLPTSRSIASAYQSVFDTGCVGGLDTPERHRNYMRAVTMAADPGSAQLNATHFYLASLLSLQKRGGEPGSGKKLLYRGRREFARTIFTTNFDPLLQTSLQLFQLLYYMTDRPEFLSADALQTDEHPAIHLFYAHGSVHRPYMANTEGQIALLKQQNARDLAAYLGNHGVIILGYSGWDDCLLEALKQTKTFSNNLYWLARGAASISEEVGSFLHTHPNAYWVEIDDGGNFMAELHSRLCPGAPNTEMLYNPIRPLLAQLGCVSLGGILGGGSENETGGAKAISALNAPIDVETIRLQVIARLEDAQKLFTEPSKELGDLDELGRQADLSFANKDWDAALTSYDLLLSRMPAEPAEKKAAVLVRRGVCHGRKGALDKEIADYSAVIEMPALSAGLIARTRFNRGFAYGSAGDTDNEMADYTAVVDLPGAPAHDVATALINRGVCFSQKGMDDEAIADYSAVIALRGATPDLVAFARVNRGVSYSEKGQTEEEIADYTAVIESPESPPDQIAKARLYRAFCESQRGETEKAVADYSAITDLPGAPSNIVEDAREELAVITLEATRSKSKDGTQSVRARPRTDKQQDVKRGKSKTGKSKRSQS